MKKTFLASLLTLILAVSCVFGLAACKDDATDPVVVKEGETAIGDVTTEPVSYDLEGTVGNYYTLAAKVNGETCMDVLLSTGPNENTHQGYGIIEQFEYYQENLKVTVSAAKTVSNVVLVYEKVDAPAPADFEEIELSATVVPELNGAEFVTYKLVIAKEGTFVVSGDINLGSDTEWADIIIGKDLDENGAVDMGTNVDIDAATGSVILEAATYYVTVYAEDSFMIAIVPEYAGTLDVGADKALTIDKLGETAVRYKLNGVEGKYYTIEATVDGSVSKDVSVKVANGAAYQGVGKVENFKLVVGETDVVTLSSVKTTGTGENIEIVELENVKITLTEVTTPVADGSEENPFTLEATNNVTSDDGNGGYVDVYYVFTPATTGWYKIFSTDADAFAVYNYDQYGEGNGFEIVVELTAETEYVFIFSTFSMSAGSFTVKVESTTAPAE